MIELFVIVSLSAIILSVGSLVSVGLFGLFELFELLLCEGVARVEV